MSPSDHSQNNAKLESPANERIISPSVILASGSPRRRELLSSLGLTFSVQPSDFDESSVKESDPAKLVVELSYHKARSVLEEISEKTIRSDDEVNDVLIIGSDTVVVLDGDVLGKPRDPKHAREMLMRLQGRQHTVYTGLCVLFVSTGMSVVSRTAFEATKVFMNPLSDETISRYVETGEPLDKAGAYAIQGLGSTLISGIEGDYFTVVGLPLQRLSRMLEEVGLPVF